MNVIPAIDLQGGRCVRLLRGDFDRETVYGDDPAVVARRWLQAGASLVHVVDLDATRAGHPVQLEAVKSIAEILPVQLGGGLRTEEHVALALEAGAQRIVIGTAALDPDLIGRLVVTHGDSLIVALDTRDGKVAVQGWTETSEHTLVGLARVLRQAGVQRFIHTDVERDGTMTAPNYDSLAALISLGSPVIASGGVASLDHIERLRALGAEAVIVGRSLYEGAFSLEEAVTRAG
ncbi:MAG: 1-(5-phosphoribosyl)-5-[(5-phosphoribosylamino) methylideneamino]imidazole-4-carboxamide isomerase [Chloroflexota bacterium]